MNDNHAKNEKFELEVVLSVEITGEDIDDIVCSALEGGITYWCDYAKVPEAEGYLGQYASEQISNGGSLLLHDFEEGRWVTLNRDNLLVGIKRAIELGYSEEWLDGRTIDTSMVDAVTADTIVQLAVFGDVIYG